MTLGTSDPLQDSAGPRRCRRFRIADGMILLAALGVWLAAVRYLLGVVQSTPMGPRHPGRWAFLTSDAFIWNAVGVGLAGVLLALLTLAFLAMRLLRPRPPVGELVRQPGTLACLVVATGFSVGAVTGVAFSWTPCLLLIGILATWALVRARGALRPEAGWIDRFGVVLGLGWSVLGLVLAVYRFVLVPLS
jgi:hypothetical protein